MYIVKWKLDNSLANRLYREVFKMFGMSAMMAQLNSLCSRRFHISATLFHGLERLVCTVFKAAIDQLMITWRAVAENDSQQPNQLQKTMRPTDG